jgi:hypothetical protein
MHAQGQRMVPDNQEVRNLAVALLNHWRDANALPPIS